MRSSSLVLVGVALGLACLLLMMVTLSPSSPSSSSASSTSSHHHLGDIERLMGIISTQNETLYALRRARREEGQTPEVDQLMAALSSKDASIMRLKEQLREASSALEEQQRMSKNGLTFEMESTVAEKENFLAVKPGYLEEECESKYGLNLVENWRRSGETWCQTDAEAKVESSLSCYPFKQQHKRDKDMFCEATNFIIDFSKISGMHGNSKPRKGDQYLSFAKQSLLSSCKKTEKYNSRLFMPHHARQMRDFEGSSDSSIYNHAVVQETPLYLLARDEDCENSFHSAADFMNMFLVLSVLRVHPSGIQVMLFDKHTDGPYLDLIKKAYSPKHPVLRYHEFSGTKVLFRKIIFHLESPAGLIFPKVSNPGPLRCKGTGLFHAYRKHILESFDLWNVPPPPIPSITLSLRHRTSTKNVGRIMQNEAEVVKIVSSVNVADVHVVDTAKMSFSEQLTLIRNTNILIGIHGAGLMFIMFAAEEAILIEVHPTYRQDRHFRHAARMTDKVYMPVRATKRETCHGSSDNVVVPIDEFQKALDGAVRIARNFDDGLAECGAQCPFGVLGLDKSLTKHYKAPFNARPLNTRFPCA